MNDRTKQIVRVALWVAAFALIVYGAMFNSYLVLDKPTSTEAAEKGVQMKIYSEVDMVNAVSTDKVERAEDGMLKTVPGAGFCES